MNNPPVLLKLDKVQKSFHKSDGQDLLVLDNIDIEVYENEIVALLGKSGSGKSTLLRIIAGLLPASNGTVTYRGQPVTKPVQGISMVFQSFALMPWLTVLQNVELGLEAQGVPKKECLKRALKAIDMIGLDGFESAYPKELSGGMCQRTGFARALVVDPDLLLMDEAFSALDVLTAETLRNDLIDLWTTRRTRMKGIFLVTHNIEEAALMADRIIILDHNPGRIRANIKVSTPLPRDPKSIHFRKLIDDIYTLMTTNGKAVKIRPQDIHTPIEPQIDRYHRLPSVGTAEIAGFIEQMMNFQQEHNSSAPIDLPALSDELSMDSDELFPLTEALEVLQFAKISKGDITLTQEGKEFNKADMLSRKQMFARQLINYVPLAQHIRQTLDKNENHLENEKHFLAELEEKLSASEADRVLRVIIDWGRYAEIFAYDYDSGNLSLENPQI